MPDELARFEEAWKGNNLGPLPDYDVQRKKGKPFFVPFESLLLPVWPSSI